MKQEKPKLAPLDPDILQKTMASSPRASPHMRRTSRLDKLEAQNRKLRSKLKKMEKRVDNVDNHLKVPDEDFNNKVEKLSDAYKILTTGGCGGPVSTSNNRQNGVTKPVGDDPRWRRFRSRSPTPSHVSPRSQESLPAVSPRPVLPPLQTQLSPEQPSPKLLQRRRHSICHVPLSHPQLPTNQNSTNVAKSEDSGEKSEDSELSTNGSPGPLHKTGTIHTESAVEISVTDLAAPEPVEIIVSNVPGSAQDGEDTPRDDIPKIPPIRNRRRNSIAVGTDLRKFQQTERKKAIIQTERKKSSSLERLESICEEKMAIVRPSFHSGTKNVPLFLHPEFFHLLQTSGRTRDKQETAAPASNPDFLKPAIPEYRMASSLRPSDAAAAPVEMQTEKKGLASWLGMSKKSLKRVQERQSNDQAAEESMAAKPRSINDRRKSVLF
ncbi:uncharacterized protein LOC106181867 isoform X1 [Lingula anatina]|uniref:Uncharacterized protein LOC106181867 isoform X1 n=2 Tax=Lingula anatina TaxID=7574 RepID=A0A1S3KH88_LINAN|nr:uncharacterized protein LOC106181867 isoform X1 [Lingula anatina]|eukprot:XP_013421839.1 uncharacterized protein LOC106181867 isoform X1 [Lingula anatina]